jgi:CO/xanthine dehydrogenase Mo-binding subunit
VKKGNVPEVLEGAARVLEAEYEWPFQSHASMGPACVLVEIRGERATVWTGSQKPHYARDGVAAILGMPEENVHGIWVAGPGCYGRNDAGDAAMYAALMAKAVGRPVRVQGMRHEGTGWDPKGPASVHFAKAGLDAQGNVIAYYFNSKGFPRQHVFSNESKLKDTLAGQLLGHDSEPNYAIYGTPAESYGFPNKWLEWEVIEPLLDRASPLRTSHLRDPMGPQMHFASEQFVDEIAAGVNADPVEFRLKYLSEERDIAAVKAAAEKMGWKPRRALPKADGGTSTVSGRGFAYAVRNGVVVAVAAEVEVDRKSGRIWPRKFAVAHDCGLIVNPGTLRRVVEANIVQSASRALWEEVRFDTRRVTSVDWRSYPILSAMDAPEEIEVVLIDRKNLPPGGAGEASSRPTAAAIANAFYDATGVRLRQAPLTPERVKAALSGT